MTHKDKDLLFKDLCGRLPYGVKGYLSGLDVRIEILGINGNDIFCKPLWHRQELIRDIRYVKPYLRPMSSMTEEEKLMYEGLMMGTDSVPYMSDVIDWLNENMFDYRGLIPKDLALSTEEYNPYEE